MSLKVFADHFSMPSRAVITLLELNKINYELKEIRLSKKENKTDDYLKVNPFGYLPSIIDGDLKLFESHTIMRYICRSRNLADHWYPKNPKEAAPVDMYLDWHPTATRKMHVGLALHINNRNKYPSYSNMESEMILLKTIFSELDSFWIKDTPFILRNEMSIADISAFSEIISLLATDFSFKSYPHIVDYLHRILVYPEVKKSHYKAFYIFKKINPYFEDRLKELKFELKDVGFE